MSYFAYNLKKKKTINSIHMKMHTVCHWSVIKEAKKEKNFECRSECNEYIIQMLTHFAVMHDIFGYLVIKLCFLFIPKLIFSRISLSWPPIGGQLKT